MEDTREGKSTVGETEALPAAAVTGRHWWLRSAGRLHVVGATEMDFVLLGRRRHPPLAPDTHPLPHRRKVTLGPSPPAYFTTAVPEVAR